MNKISGLFPVKPKPNAKQYSKSENVEIYEYKGFTIEVCGDPSSYCLLIYDSITTYVIEDCHCRYESKSMKDCLKKAKEIIEFYYKTHEI